jgi:hypothetical protein
MPYGASSPFTFRSNLDTLKAELTPTLTVTQVKVCFKDLFSASGGKMKSIVGI